MESILVQSESGVLYNLFPAGFCFKKRGGTF